MAGYDVPHVTHDMILRFMGVDFSVINDGTAKIPSSVGDHVKAIPTVVAASATPTLPPAKSPEQDKAMWEGELHHLHRESILTFLSSVL